MVIEVLEQFYDRERKILARAEAEQSSDLVEHRAEVKAIKITIDLLKDYFIGQEISKIL